MAIVHAPIVSYYFGPGLQRLEGRTAGFSDSIWPIAVPDLEEGVRIEFTHLLDK